MKKEVAKAYAYLAMVRSEGEALKALQDAYQEADRYE